MRCHGSTKKLMAYHDGELSASEKSRVEEHLLACPSCKAVLDDLACADASSAPSEPSAAYWANFTSRVMARIPAEAPARVRAAAFSPPRSAYLRWIPAASAALVLIAAAGYFVGIEVGSRRQALPGTSVLMNERSAADFAAVSEAPAPAVLAAASSAFEGLPARDLLRSNLAGGELVLVQVLKIRPNGDVYELSALKSDLLRSGLLERSQMLREAVSPVGDPELTRLLDDLVASMRSLQDATPQDLSRVQDGIRQSGVVERAAEYKEILAGGGERF